MGWQTFLRGVCFSVAGLMLGLAKLNNPDYNLQGWHSTPLTIAIVIACTLFNVFLTARLPLVEVLVLILHILGVFVIIIRKSAGDEKCAQVEALADHGTFRGG